VLQSLRTAPTPSPAAVAGKPRRPDVPALTGLRFVAAFSVLLAHGVSATMTNNQPAEGVVFWLTTASGPGMTLFFVLSGFVIHYNYATLVTDGGVRGIGVFLWARFARLYPLFLLMLLVYVTVSSRTVALLTGHPGEFVSLLHALPYFLLSIQSWVYKIIGSDSLIDAVRGGSPPTWSISTEWFFYLAYPAVAWLILRARSVPAIVVVFVAWCALWTALSCGLHDRVPQINAWAIARFGPIAGVDDHENSFVRWLLYLSPYLRIGEFILGVCTAQLYISLRGRKPGRLENAAGTAVLLAAIVSVFVIDCLEYDPTLPVTIFRKMNLNFALAPSVAVVVFCAARYRNAVSRLLTSVPALRLGEASYSIYLFHSIVFISAVKLSGDAVHGAAYDSVKLTALIGIVIAVSLALYAWYEAPARNWLRRRASTSPAFVALAEAPQTSAPKAW
jgi:hypothetical protein